MSIEISFEQMLNQWKTASSKFAINYYKTKIEIGETYVREYKRAFDIKQIPGSNNYWRNRKRENSHPILHETGTLKNSISYQLFDGDGLQIYTDESKFPVGRRKNGSKSYAAFHNSPDGTYPPNIQRQFIGDSPLIELKVQNMLYKLLQSILA